MDLQKFLFNLTNWANSSHDIQALIMVGSYARGEAKPDSDLDLVIITTNPDFYLSNAFRSEFGNVLKTQQEDWGAVTSLRTWYEDFLEVEFSITTKNWIAKPLDAGTYSVLLGGYEVIMDKEGYFNDLNLK